MKMKDWTYIEWFFAIEMVILFVIAGVLVAMVHHVTMQRIVILNLTVLVELTVTTLGNSWHDLEIKRLKREHDAEIHAIGFKPIK